MEFFIVVESCFIEEVCKVANHPAACFPVVEISVNLQFIPGFFKFLMVSDNHSLLTDSDLTLGLMRFELAF